MARKNTARRAAEKAIKKTHSATVFLVILFLIIGIVAGVAASMLLTKNDKFVLNGEKEIHLAVGETFTDPGATVCSFGRDLSGMVQVGGDRSSFDPSVEGIYQFVYTVEDFRWGDYQLVRTVIVGDPTAQGSDAGEE